MILDYILRKESCYVFLVLCVFCWIWVTWLCILRWFQFFAYREVKFKRTLRLQFWLIFQNLFCRWHTSKLWSDPDMINPSIESSDFLFWRVKKFFRLIFENLWKTEKVNFTISNLMCVYTHSKFQNMKFSNILKIFFTCQNRKSELSIDGLIISGLLQSFTLRKR